jgi:aspartate kinase
MALIVHKYGGTSMGSTERIRNVAKRVAKWARAGHQMVVVPSAMSGETNRLLGLAKELAPAKTDTAYDRELDMLAATGEQASSALLAIALIINGSLWIKSFVLSYSLTLSSIWFKIYQESESLKY